MSDGKGPPQLRIGVTSTAAGLLASNTRAERAGTSSQVTATRLVAGHRLLGLRLSVRIAYADALKLVWARICSSGASHLDFSHAWCFAEVPALQ